MAIENVDEAARRRELALTACCQIGVIAQAIGRQVDAKHELDEYELETVVRALVARLIALDEVIVDALSANSEASTKQLQDALEVAHG